MDSLLYTLLITITSVGSATLTYVIMEARLRVIVAEERARSAEDQGKQMRQVLDPQANREWARQQTDGELLAAEPLLEVYPGLQTMALPVVRIPAILPPAHQNKKPIRRSKLGPWIGIIDKILKDDESRPKKQRHTAKRIWERLKDEHGFTGGYTIVKDYVREARRRQEEISVPLAHPPKDAQVGFDEALAMIAGKNCNAIAPETSTSHLR